MKPIIIFGNEECAEIAHFYFQHDTKRDVKAFTIDQVYIKHDHWHGLPVVPFETITDIFPPSDYDMFVAIGYSKVNKVRREKYLAAKAKGYTLPRYISSKATIWSQDIGDNCFLLEDNTVQPFVKIGNNVTLWSGNHIGHHSIIEDHCFITSHVVVSGKAMVGEGSFLGVNATIRDHIQIGKYCVIGAGALIKKNTADNEVYSASGTSAGNITSDALKKL